MKLYIGGLGHGQDTLAYKETSVKPAVCDSSSALSSPGIDKFHLLIKEVISEGKDPLEYTALLIKNNPDAVIVSDEVGSGIHPIDRNELYWREMVGRSLCLLAEKAESLTRVFCGIGTRIK